MGQRPGQASPGFGPSCSAQGHLCPCRRPGLSQLDIPLSPAPELCSLIPAFFLGMSRAPVTPRGV